jgi:SAM-dependent methyltransferase
MPGPDQYATDANLRARQGLWANQQPPFDLYGWVIGLSGARPGTRVLDVGCGNGAYLTRMRQAGTGAWAVGCDLSMGMLRAAPRSGLVNADAERLPIRTASFDVVLAAHMLYHVPDRQQAAAEMRRVLVPGGTCLVVTNGGSHIASLRRIVESVVQVSTPGWRMIDWATQAFSLDHGLPVLRTAFEQVECLRPPVRSHVVITDATVVADYVASVADAYEGQVAVPWVEVVEGTRRAVQDLIDREGAVTTAGDTGVFVCR